MLLIYYLKKEDIYKYNIGTTEKLTISNLAKNIGNLLNKKIQIQKSPLKKGGTKIRIPDISLIKNINFKQKYKIKNGLRKTIDFYNK